ncbi:MAG: TonB-dependent receptor plug domain-containing protein [Povalibacter sp.]
MGVKQPHLKRLCSAESGVTPSLERLIPRFAIALVLAIASTTAVWSAALTGHFKIPSQNLADALDRFGEQSGLQVVYDPSAIAGWRASAVAGELRPADALDALLSGSRLVWNYVNERTVVVRPPGTAKSSEQASDADLIDDRLLRTDSSVPVTRLSVVQVSEDPRRVLPNAASDSSFGFAKPLLETPRSVSFISEETIDLFGLSAVEDLVRMVPGVFTTTRFGIQGAVDVRAVPADTFFRGMRRLSLQGNGRSVLAAMDTIEIVGGPPSPIYGLGKIGGYTNVVPKSGRAQSGSYLTEVEGFAQAIGGTYERRELSFGIGGPLALQRFDRHGGYYVYGLGEDSGSYAAGVPVRQQVLQAAISIDDFAGPFRLETGANYQLSRTAGALTGRFTQDLVDRGRYIRGTPLVNLDANNGGRIGYLEMQHGSPVTGALSVNNQPLMQTWSWPTDASGQPLPIDKFPVILGIPQSMYDYLVAHPEADPTGLLRAQGVGGPLPQSRSVPVGMVLDPRTVGYDTLDMRRAGAFEKELEAKFLTLFFDLVLDTDPDFTAKNQLFFDRMDQYKNSNQPFVQEQSVYVIEDKFTVTRRIETLPSWLRVNALASLNARNTVSRGQSAGNDFGSHRSDVMASTWRDETGGMTPNTTFESPLDNADLYDDGYPWGTIYRTEFSEFGLGLLFDVELGSRWALMIGGRYDRSRAENVDYAESFNPTTGTAANPGAYFGSDMRASAWDGGASWNVSVSYALTPAIRPYITFAESSVMLDANNNQLTNAVIQAGHIGSSRLNEIGVKASVFDDRLFMTAAGYEQARTDIEADDPSALLYAYATATKTRGLTAELKWVPAPNTLLSLYGMKQTTRFDPNVGSTQLVDARTLGFQDIVDAQGNVIYPAEAFLYGGRSRIVLPGNVSAYAKKEGNPDVQLGFSTTYQWHNGLGFTLSGNYFSSTCTGRLCTVRIPQSFLGNAGVFLSTDAWLFKLDFNNIFDQRYFRARTGDTLGNPLAQALPDRRWQFTIKTQF